jgi:hypothetical protein
MGILFLDDVTFTREPNVGLVIIKITRSTSITIIGFDLHSDVVGDLAIRVMHFGFFMKVAIWIKTKERANGR